MDAMPPGPPGPPSAPPTNSSDLISLISSNDDQIDEEIPPPPGIEAFPEPLPVTPVEPNFGDVDISEWDSNWEEDWNSEARVFRPEDPEYVPETIQEEVEWNVGDPAVPVTMNQEPVPSKSALNKMKKTELADFANARGVDSSGTKKDIIERLHS
jgi:hypothetical protein